MRFICNQDGILFPLDEFLMWSPENNCFSSNFRSDTWISDNVQSVLKHSQRIHLDCNVPFFDARTANIGCDTELLKFLLNGIMFTSCCYKQVAKLFLENNNIFICQAAKLENEGRQWQARHGSGRLDQATIFCATCKNLELLSMAGLNQINTVVVALHYFGRPV